MTKQDFENEGVELIGVESHPFKISVVTGVDTNGWGDTDSIIYPVVFSQETIDALVGKKFTYDDDVDEEYVRQLFDSITEAGHLGELLGNVNAFDVPGVYVVEGIMHLPIQEDENPDYDEDDEDQQEKMFQFFNEDHMSLKAEIIQILVYDDGNWRIPA